MNGLDHDFPDMETALIRFFPGAIVVRDAAGILIPGATVASNTVLDLSKSEYFIRVAAISLPNDGVTQFVTVDIDTFAPTRAVSYDLGVQVGRKLRETRRISGVVIDDMSTVTGPRRLPWDNTRTRRHGATYRLSTRR